MKIISMWNSLTIKYENIFIKSKNNSVEFEVHPKLAQEDLKGLRIFSPSDLCKKGMKQVRLLISHKFYII